MEDSNSFPISWYIPDKDGLQALGPFTTQQIRVKLKEKTLSFDQFISSPELENGKWYRLYEIKDFQALMTRPPLCQPPKLFRTPKKNNSATNSPADLPHHAPENSQIQTKVPINAQIILHNGTRVQKGVVTEISSETLEITLLHPNKFEKGEELVFTFFGLTNVIGFSGVCVVSKATKDEKELQLYLLRINPDSKKRFSQLLKAA